MGWWEPAPRKPELQRLREEVEDVARWLRVIAARTAAIGSSVQSLLWQAGVLQQSCDRVATTLDAVRVALEVAGAGNAEGISKTVAELRASTTALARVVQEHQPEKDNGN